MTAFTHAWYMASRMLGRGALLRQEALDIRGPHPLARAPRCVPARLRVALGRGHVQGSHLRSAIGSDQDRVVRGHSVPTRVLAQGFGGHDGGAVSQVAIERAKTRRDGSAKPQ